MEEYWTSIGNGEVLNIFALRLEKISPIRARKNVYTPILVIFAAIARNHGKFAGLVCLQMWSDSADPLCAALFYHCRSFGTPTTPVTCFVVVNICPKLARIGECRKASHFAWIIPQMKFWDSGQARCFIASLMLLFRLVPVPRSFDKVSKGQSVFSENIYWALLLGDFHFSFVVTQIALTPRCGELCRAVGFQLVEFNHLSRLTAKITTGGRFLVFGGRLSVTGQVFNWSPANMFRDPNSLWSETERSCAGCDVTCRVSSCSGRIWQPVRLQVDCRIMFWWYTATMGAKMSLIVYL